MDKKIRVRFAPSPTGELHLGGLRTALYNYIFAKANKGDFLLRIEDTDQNRYVEGAVNNIIDNLLNIGLVFDEGPTKEKEKYAPYFQSQRLEIYKKYVDLLIKKDSAYYCFCSKEDLTKMRERQASLNIPPRYDERCRNLSVLEVEKKLAENIPYVVRLKMPKDKQFVIYDQVRGKTKIDSSLVDDQVIMKSDGFPTYHLAACIDDHLMEITHVIRGEEWLSSTPKHLFIYESLNLVPPKWIHLPLILNSDRTKLSKRHGNFSVDSYLKKGYLKETIINFVALLGWHPVEETEIFDLDYMIKNFSFDRVNKAGAIFDEKKLEWMNGLYIRSKPLEEIAKLCENYFIENKIDISSREKYLKVIEIARDHIVRLPEIIENSIMFYEDIKINESDREYLETEESKKIFEYILDNIDNVSWNVEEITVFLKKTSKSLNIKGKNFFSPLRLSLYGNLSGPQVPLIFDILGRELIKKRIKLFS